MRHRRAILLAPCLLLLGVATSARAFIVDINNGSRQLYFRVGNPGSGINIVSVSIAGGALGNGVGQAMSSNALQATSEYDGFVFCNPPLQVYVGGYYRKPGNSNTTGLLTITAPLSLTNATGNTIPFSQISWTSSGNQDTGAEPFPAGDFSSTSVSYNFPSNTWRESCHAFTYKNANFVAAGTYTGTVVYTLSAP